MSENDRSRVKNQASTMFFWFLPLVPRFYSVNPALRQIYWLRQLIK